MHGQEIHYQIKKTFIRNKIVRKYLEFVVWVMFRKILQHLVRPGQIQAELGCVSSGVDTLSEKLQNKNKITTAPGHQQQHSLQYIINQTTLFSFA